MDKTKYERIVKTFYDYLEEGKVMGRKCTRCGAVEFPPYLACNTCGCPKTEWEEISGEAEVTGFRMESLMHSEEDIKELHGDYCYATVKLKEGAELNTVVVGVTAAMKDELMEKIPFPVKPYIAQRDGYKAVFWQLDE